VFSGYQMVSEKWGELFKNIWSVDLHLKNKAATFALPIGNNGTENDQGHEFREYRSNVL
jgi:hypothetical protein